MLALARWPWPSALTPELTPTARAMGPLTMSTGPANMVVHRRPCMPNSSIKAASTAANTSGMYSGLQPAITALMATFSTVHACSSGGTEPNTSPGRRVVPASMRNTRCGVGGTTGKPSVQPRLKHASMSSSESPRVTWRDCNGESPKRNCSSSATPGSRVLDAHPARKAGKAAPRAGKPLMSCQSPRCQPWVRATSRPASTRMSVGTNSVFRRYECSRVSSCTRPASPAA